MELVKLNNVLFSALGFKVAMKFKSAIAKKRFSKEGLRELNAYTKRFRNGLGGEEIILSPSQVLMFAGIFKLREENISQNTLQALMSYLDRLEAIGRSTVAINLDENPEGLLSIMFEMCKRNITEGGETSTPIHRRY